MDNLQTDREKAKEITDHLAILRLIRQPYEAQIDEVIKYVNHSRRKIIDKDINKGLKTGIDVYDGTAISAANILTDGLCGYTATPSLIWYKYTLPGKLNFPRTSGMRGWSGKRMDEYPEVREWLTDCEDVTWSAFLRSNFYDVIPEFIKDGVSIGTSTMLIEEDLKKDRIVFTCPHFREGYFAEDRYGVVDTYFRVYKISLRDLIDKFTIERMSKIFLDLTNMLKRNPFEEREVLHATFPRRDISPYRIDNKNMPVASYWIIMDKKNEILGEDGYEELPSVTWRWRKNNDEICGRSPSWDAYIEIMKGNQQGKTNLIAGHKAVDGPMVAVESMRGKIFKEAGATTFVQNMEREKPEPLLTNMQLPYGIDQQDRTDKIIREFFYVDFFLMLNRAAFEKVELTATQTIGMQAEQATVLSIRTGRLGSEAYNPTHDRVFAIEDRNRRIPMPPDLLQEQILLLSRKGRKTKIEIDYVGPLAQVQKRLVKYQAIRAGLEFLGSMQQIAPESMDEVNISQIIREGLDSISFPANCLNSDEQRDKIRQVRQQKREMEESIQAAGEIGKVVQRTSKEVQPGSPMEMIMGGGGGVKE